MLEPEETAEEQPDDSRSVLEAAYEEAAKDEEPEKEVAVEPETPAAPEEVPAEAAAPETKEAPETPAEEEATPEEIDAPAQFRRWKHQEMFRGLDGKAQKFLVDRIQGDGGGSYQAQPGSCTTAKSLRALGSLPESNSGGAITGVRLIDAV